MLFLFKLFYFVDGKNEFVMQIVNFIFVSLAFKSNG